MTNKPKLKKMSRAQIARLKVGDRIKVRTFHYREGYRTVSRKITQISDTMGIAISMFGYRDFWLRKGEILEKIRP
jgi:hypothetical protein